MNDLRTPYNKFVLVSPDDSADLPLVGDLRPIGLYTGSGGDIVGVMPDNTTITFVGTPAGMMWPLSFRRVNATNTTATGLIALYAV